MFAMLSAIGFLFLFGNPEHRREFVHIYFERRFADFLDPLRLIVSQSDGVGEVFEFTPRRTLMEVEEFEDAGVGDPLFPVEVGFLGPVLV